MLNRPEVYAEADIFIEATDWVIMRLTGNETRKQLHRKDTRQFGISGTGFPRRVLPALTP